MGPQKKKSHPQSSSSIAEGAWVARMDGSQYIYIYIIFIHVARIIPYIS